MKQNTIEKISSKVTTEEQDNNNFQSHIGHERLFNDLFRELGLNAAQAQLIRAFLIASKGEVEFEASFTNLADICYKTGGKYDKTYNERVKYAVKTLLNWQDENKITLIQVTRKGARVEDDEGTKKYVPSKYKFILLAELAKELYKDSDDFEPVIKKVIQSVKEKFVPREKTRNYHPNHKIKKFKNTIFKLFQHIFDLTIKAGDEPVSKCRRILDKCEELLTDLENEWTAYQNREKFIAAFEKKIHPDFLNQFRKNNSND